MLAAQFSEHGGPSVVRVNNVERPSAGKGRVLVRVEAASINPFDDKMRGGAYGAMGLQLPVTLGGDLAGEVVELGEGVEGLAAGDKVYGQAYVVAKNSGSFAEYAATKASQVALAPRNVDMQTAAALPLVGVSALQALTRHIGLKRGQKLLIQGGAGGIGHIALQIAKHIGAQVAVTVSGADVDFAKQMGADIVIDYSKQRFEDVVHGFDAVFDTVGGEVFRRSLSVVKRGGMVVSMLGPADEEAAKELGVTVVAQQSRVNREMLDELRELVEQGAVKVRIDSVYPLAQVREAFEKFENGARGKVVIRIP